MIWGPITTPTASIRPARSETMSAGSPPWAFASPSNPPADTRPCRVTSAVVPFPHPGSASRLTLSRWSHSPVPGLIFRSGQLVGQVGAGDHDGQVRGKAHRGGQIFEESHRITGT